MITLIDLLYASAQCIQETPITQESHWVLKISQLQITCNTGDFEGSDENTEG